MKTEKNLSRMAMIAFFASCVLLIAGCKSTGTASSTDMSCCSPEGTNATLKMLTPIAMSAPVTNSTAPLTQAVESAELPPVRIKAGPSPKFTDADGNLWIPDRGFLDGDTFERPELVVANTKTPVIYQSERYGMSAFSYPVPNGKYVVKLHFAEGYEGIEGPGDRVFSFNVEGKEFKDFDVWVKAGGPRRAYVESVPVEVTDGKLDITFIAKEQNPLINGIEILPGE